MPLNRQNSADMKKAREIFSPGETIKIAPSDKREKLIRGVKADISHTLEENILISIFETFSSRYPNFIDYRLGREKMEGKDYLGLKVGNDTCFVTCTKANIGMDNEHLCLSVFSNLDFYYSKSKKVDIFKNGKMSTWDSEFGKSDELIEKIDISAVLNAFLAKISTY